MELKRLQKIQEMLKDPKEIAGALYGTLLGDSSLVKPIPGNSRFTFGQNNEAYAHWKALLFEGIGSKTPVKYGSTWRSESPRLPLFTKLYHKMYYNGRKTVPEHAMKVITPLGLALLYMDDGDFHKQKQEVKISTMCFNQAEHDLLQKGLFKRFNLRFNIHRRKGYGGKRKSHYYYLRMKQGDRIAFFDLVTKFIPDCMKYKVPTAEGMKKIETRSRLAPEDIDKLLTPQTLFDMRYKQNMSLWQMQAELGVNSGTILGRLRKLENQISVLLH